MSSYVCPNTMPKEIFLDPHLCLKTEEKNPDLQVSGGSPHSPTYLTAYLQL